MYGLLSMKNQVTVPTRHVLCRAMETNQRLGHENLGFLSNSHGFMPRIPPLLSLPSTYVIWDEYGQRLPEFSRELTLRTAFDKMPIIDVDEKHLPDEYLLRASVLISIFAHAYYYIEPTPPTVLPASIHQPWKNITERLGRKAPHLSYIDLAIYNWQLIDKERENPFCVENMRPLVPVWGNEAERLFLMTVIEVLIRSTPLIEAIVSAQEAVVRDDAAALINELLVISRCIHQITYETLPKTSLNEFSTYYTDPGVWAKTFAPFSVPIRSGVAAAGGAATPSLQVLDAFFGRKSYKSQIGHEMTWVREWYPKHWQDFYHAVQQISIPNYVQKKSNRTLSDIYNDALHAYVGETGFMERHRIKVYGYTEIAFKTGRPTTGGHIEGGFRERTWDQVDDALEIARRERFKNNNAIANIHYGKVIDVSDLSKSGRVSKVKISIIEGTVCYHPGDRCAILPENSDELVHKTLRSLKCQGNEEIQLDVVWQSALNERDRYRGSKTLPLRMLLKFGAIRPVKRLTVEILYKKTKDLILKEIVDSHTEDDWELWELLSILGDRGFDYRELCCMKLGKDDNWVNRKSIICKLIPPLDFRMYSISSVMKEEERRSHGASTICLTVDRLQYQTKKQSILGQAKKCIRYGTASKFLTTEIEKKFALKIVHPPFFSLPKNISRPIVMFAGGTGISPFLSFLHERVRYSESGENWLFLGTRTQNDFYYQDELKHFIKQGKLNLRVAFSREDIFFHYKTTQLNTFFSFESGNRHKIGEEILSDKNIHHLWYLLRSPSEGGLGAYIYVCGRSGFAKSVMNAIMTIFDRFHGGNNQEKQRAFYRLVAEGRYMQDIFTTYTPSQSHQQNLIHVSEVARHNNKQDGYWLIIDGGVYDLSEFMCIHPGGFKILRNYVGMDATHAYKKVQHHLNPDVQSRLEMYKIGIIHQLKFNYDEETIAEDGMKVQSLYQLWVDCLYVVIETENALYVDYGIRQSAATYDEISQFRTLSPFKIQLLIQVHKRFIELHVRFLLMKIQNLWEAISSVCDENNDWMAITISEIQQSEQIAKLTHLTDQVLDLLKSRVASNKVLNGIDCMTIIKKCCCLFEDEDKHFIEKIRLTLRSGLQLFEQYEQNIIKQGGKQLLKLLEEIPYTFSEYNDSLSSGCSGLVEYGSLLLES